ncbi:MAG: T9SS type A sorting domain-containing protein, partial [Bacteroidota bacterium]
LAQQIRLFPNPTSGSIQVDLSAITQLATLRLMDARGRQLMKRKATQRVTTLDMKAISPSAGLYFLEVQAGERQAVLKVMIN